MKLTGKQKRHLRGLGHALRFQVQIGKHGVTDTVVGSVDTSLAKNELIKIKFGPGFDGDLAVAVAELAGRTDSFEVGSVGKTALLYRPDPDAPRIQLPHP